uniref:Reverse transcriptase RNase H-like domain-containing protein n=1 Tax=Bos indicus x Bos taurus TaxID=30522 RepID=A0A4W2G7G3_BOBOX
IALGVLRQNQDPSLTPVIYLSKQLDTKIQGWSACLRALTTVALLTQESKKLTFEPIPNTAGSRTYPRRGLAN